MPKTRGSNTIASRGNVGSGSAAAGVGVGNFGGGAGSGGSVNETIPRGEISVADVINQRLQSVGPVTVRMESTTRRTTEDVIVAFNNNEPGHAAVTSASGNTYDVDYHNGTCTCMHFTTRQNGCRHIDATNIAVGQITEGSNNYAGDAGQPGDLGTAVMRQELQDINEENNRPSSGAFEDDGLFYSDNITEFNRTMRNLSSVQREYQYENVLNGSEVTFGLELEFEGGNADAIARELYQLGICAYPERVSYHHSSVNGKWKLERDGSVSSGPAGGELVSPVLRDTPETWRNIEKICEVANRNGGRVTMNTGGHVHIGMDPLDTARQRWRRFFKVLGGFEECVYRFSGGDLGHIRSGYSHYATSFANNAQNAATSRFQINDTDDVRDLARRVGGHDRYRGMNLTNIPADGKPDTVEFRYFNGSLNPKQIQTNVKIAAGVVMAAEKVRTKDVESEGIVTSESMKRRGAMLNESANTNDRNHAQIAKFVDIIFTRKEDKDDAISVFAKNEWR